MPRKAEPRRLPLHERHAALGARFTSFAGWQMPLQYAGILAEHHAVRQRAGVFDISHMGRIAVAGPDAGRQIRSVVTFDTTTMRAGRAHYALSCDERGGIVDDPFIYRSSDEDWLVVHNAANREVGLERLRTSAGDAASDVTDDTVMLAVQGPEAPEMLQRVLGAAFAEIGRRRCAQIRWRGQMLLAARTGYTGEEGAELIASGKIGGELWDELIAMGLSPAGIGARDTLRLEAALALHGQDIDRTTNPFEAGLGWVVSLDDERPFTGRDALARLSEEPAQRTLAHLRLLERGVPRPGYAVTDPASGVLVSTLTSGTLSPTLRAGIGMAYLPVGLSVVGTPLTVNCRGTEVAAEVVQRPFYRREA